MLVPVETPVTSPVLFTVATDGVAEIHGFDAAGVPEPVNWVVEPSQTNKVPVITGMTLTVAVTAVLVADKQEFGSSREARWFGK